jgi:hypothetical protein
MLGEAMETMAVTMLTRQWRRSALQMMTRRNLIPWLIVKSVLTALVFSGWMSVGTAFVLDTIVSIVVIAYGWHVARRQMGVPAANR